MLNRLLRLSGRAWASLSADFLIYVIVPASLLMIAAALYPEEFEEKLLSVSKVANIDLPMPNECSGKLGMEAGDVKIAFVKFQRIYWSRDCGALSTSLKLFELGGQYNDRVTQGVGLATAAELLPQVRQAAQVIVHMFINATAEDLSVLKDPKCQWRVKRGREDTTFGLVCPLSRRSIKMM